MNIQRISSGNVQADAANQTQRKPMTHKNSAAVKQSSDQVAAQVQENKPKPMNARLAAYAESIDTRLNAAIGSADNSPRQKAALEAAQEHFHNMISRLDQAFLTDGRPKVDMSAGQGMGKIFEHLSAAVTTVMTHGKVDVQG